MVLTGALMGALIGSNGLDQPHLGTPSVHGPGALFQFRSLGLLALPKLLRRSLIRSCLAVDTVVPDMQTGGQASLHLSPGTCLGCPLASSAPGLGLWDDPGEPMVTWS